MGTILINSFGLFVIIFFGFLVKRVGLLSKVDGDTLSRIIINVTLPAAVLVNLQKLTVHVNLLFLILAGFLLNLLMVVVGNLLSKKQTTTEREFIMYCGSGYNIGNFALPFLQSFLPQAIPFLSFFDIGNSIMLAGGTNVAVDNLVGDEREKPNLFSIVKRLGTSVPFMCYLVMFILRSFSIDLPASFFQIMQPIANANAFLSMFVIGLYLELRLPKKDFSVVVRLLSIKYFFGIIIAVIFFLLPLPNLVKVVLCLVSVGPIPMFGVVNSAKAGMPQEVIGFSSSLSFLISLPLMTAMLLFML
ncbi:MULTISPECIES: AEC family transporter [Enterococcus]|uniref:Transporter n=1 Tax=Enterococcus alishanensis TaxID=1303817 RepID=A0ABS6T7N8_9ENTE|nr:AEC family transporter [Enterococcus alishanensis]MBV7389162.1 transporter [Enterococcus alishanensis]